MPRSLAPVAAACALVLLVSSCSLLESEEEEPGPLDFPPNELSPDRIVHCEDEGDCGEEGAVRWSTPLEGEYRVTADYPGSGLHSRTVPAQDQYTPFPDGHSAEEHEGTLYLQDEDRVSAFDAETAETLWSDEHIDPDRNKHGEELWAVGDALALQATDPRSEEGLVYLVRPRADGADWAQVESPEPGGVRVDAVVGDSHLLLRAVDGEPLETEEEWRYHLVDAATGDVEWTQDLPGKVTPDAVDEGSNQVVLDDSDATFVALEDGEIVETLEPDKGPGEQYRPWTADGGDVLLYTTVCQSDFRNICSDRAIAVDASTGEELWSHPRHSMVTAVVETDGADMVLLREGVGHPIVDVRTGEEVDTHPREYPQERARGVQVEPANGGTERSLGRQSQERLLFLPEMEVEDPATEGLDVDTGLALHPLTTYVTDDDSVVTAFTGCAPDGLRAARADTAAEGDRCVQPRLFTIDLGD